MTESIHHKFLLKKSRLKRAGYRHKRRDWLGYGEKKKVVYGHFAADALGILNLEFIFLNWYSRSV